MLCPRDGTELAPFPLLGVQLDRCGACAGIWFDRGEFDAVRKLKPASAALPAQAKPVSGVAASKKLPVIAACPRCGGRMSRFNYALDSALAIDMCQNCAGYWFDGGELAIALGGAPTTGSKSTKGTEETLVSILLDLVTLKSR